MLLCRILTHSMVGLKSTVSSSKWAPDRLRPNPNIGGQPTFPRLGVISSQMESPPVLFQCPRSLQRQAKRHVAKNSANP